MLLLASILGPAKPPVATAEELALAPAAYKISGTSGALVAERPDSTPFTIPNGDRCLVCLSEYEIDEEVRQLIKCGHLYHRTCIDEVWPREVEPKHGHKGMILTYQTPVVNDRTELLSSLPRSRRGREARACQGRCRIAHRADTYFRQYYQLNTTWGSSGHSSDAALSMR